MQKILNIFYEIKSCLRLKPFDLNESDGRDNERHRRIILSYITSILAKIIAILVLIVSTPMILNYLGKEKFGIWMTVVSLVTVFGFSDLGIGNGLINVIAEANGSDEKEKAKKAVSSSFVCVAVISLLITLVFIAIYPFVNWNNVFGATNPENSNEAGQSICVLVFCLAANLPFLGVQKVQAGYQEGYTTSIWQGVGSIFTISGILLGIYYKLSLPWFVFAAAGGPVVALLLNWVYHFLFIRKWLFPKVINIEWKMVQRLLVLGAIMTWLQLMGFIGSSSDNLIISYIFGAEQVGSYAVMTKLFAALLITQLLSASLWPAFGEALERGDLEWVLKTFNRTVILFSSFGLLCGLIVGFGSFWIIEKWVGPELKPTLSMAIGFAIWCFIGNLYLAIAALMSNNQMIKKLAILTTIAAMVSFLLKLIFAPSLGVSFIIWGTVIGYAIVCIPGLVLAYISLKKEISIKQLQTL